MTTAHSRSSNHTRSTVRKHLHFRSCRSPSSKGRKKVLKWNEKWLLKKGRLKNQAKRKKIRARKSSNSNNRLPTSSQQNLYRLLICSKSLSLCKLANCQCRRACLWSRPSPPRTNTYNLSNRSQVYSRPPKALLCIFRVCSLCSVVVVSSRMMSAWIIWKSMRWPLTLKPITSSSTAPYNHNSILMSPHHQCVCQGSSKNLQDRPACPDSTNPSNNSTIKVVS